MSQVAKIFVLMLTVNQPDQALAAFEQALVLDPTYAAAMGNRAQVLQALGRS